MIRRVAKRKLINVRLEADDVARVRALKESGVELSAIVRHAVRSEYARRLASRTRAGVVRTLREIYAAHPAEPTARRTFDVHDRQAFASAMRRHLKRRQR